MVAVGEAAVLVMRWFVLVMGDLRSSLNSWRLFQYLSLIALHVKKELLVSVVWWFAWPYVGRLMKVAVRRYKLQKLAQYISDIKGFINAGGTGSVNDQASLDRLCQLTNGTQDPEKIMNLLGNRICEHEAVNNDDRSLDQLVVVLRDLAGRARKLQVGYDWFAVLLYLSTVLGTVVIVRLWIGPPPSYGSPENYKWLPSVLVCALVIIVHQIRLDVEVPHGIADDILAILTQPIQQEQPHSTESILDASQPQLIQQEQPRSSESIPVQQEEPHSTESILDANQHRLIQQEQPRSTESTLHVNHPQPVQQEEPQDANEPQLIQQEQPRRTESILHVNHPQPVQQEEPRNTESILDANHPQPASQEQPLSTDSTLNANYPEPIQPEQPRRTVSILDAKHVMAATASILSSMEDKRCQIFPISSPQPDLSDYDGGSSSSSDDDIINYWHAPLNSLEAGDANLIVAGYIQMLQEKTRGLPAADAAEMVRTVFIHAPESDSIYRLSQVNANQWILHAGTENFSDPPVLTGTSTKSFVMMSKITAKLGHLIWLELAGQNWQLCKEVREECFLWVVGQSLQKLVNVAVLFCRASWSADYSLKMLIMFDGLVDVLYTIRDLPLDRYDLIHNKFANIFCDMMSAIKSVIRGTTDAIHDSNESTIHPVTFVLLEVLEFFCRNSNVVQYLLDFEDGNTDPCSYIFDCWVRNLKSRARKMFPKKGQGFIFILNNLYFVKQKKWNQGVPPNLDARIKHYTERYLHEYWVPVVGYLDGETPCLSLVNFTRNFCNICDEQQKWKVGAELKTILRGRIENLIVEKYTNLLDTVQAYPRWRWPFRICQARSQKLTTVHVQPEIRALFELP